MPDAREKVQHAHVESDAIRGRYFLVSAGLAVRERPAIFTPPLLM